MNKNTLNNNITAEGLTDTLLQTAEILTNIHSTHSNRMGVFYCLIPNDWVKATRIYTFLAKYSCSIDKELRRYARHVTWSKYKRYTQLRAQTIKALK